MCIRDSPGVVDRYLQRISGPLLDRIDLHVEVVPVPFRELSTYHAAESSAKVRQRVTQARRVQLERFARHPGTHCNAMMSSRLLREHCRVNEPGQQLLRSAMERLGLSARAYDRILKVARTIADMEGSPGIEPHHLAEAINYRSMDRSGWGKTT